MYNGYATTSRSICLLRIFKISSMIFKFNPEELCNILNIKIPVKAYIYYNTKPSKSDLYVIKDSINIIAIDFENGLIEIDTQIIQNTCNNYIEDYILHVPDLQIGNRTFSSNVVPQVL